MPSVPRRSSGARPAAGRTPRPSSATRPNPPSSAARAPSRPSAEHHTPNLPHSTRAAKAQQALKSVSLDLSTGTPHLPLSGTLARATRPSTPPRPERELTVGSGRAHFLGLQPSSNRATAATPGARFGSGRSWMTPKAGSTRTLRADEKGWQCPRRGGSRSVRFRLAPEARERCLPRQDVHARRPVQ